jgi:DNA transposition AAA+ family ATPase
MKIPNLKKLLYPSRSGVPLSVEVQQRIRELHASGYNRSQIARTMGLSRPTVSKYIYGVCCVLVNRCQLLTTILIQNQKQKRKNYEHR